MKVELQETQPIIVPFMQVFHEVAFDNGIIFALTRLTNSTLDPYVAKYTVDFSDSDVVTIRHFSVTPATCGAS